MSTSVLALAVPELRSFEQLPPVRAVSRYAVLAPDHRTVLVSIDSPAVVSRFRQLMAVPAIGAGVLELLAAGTADGHGFVVQPLPAPVPETTEPAALARLLAPVAEALTALHAAGYCLGGLSAGMLALGPTGQALIADLLPAVPLHSRARPGELSRLAGGLPSPPELGDGRPMTAATDLFGLAALILTMLTGSGRWVGNPAAALRSLPVDSSVLVSALSIDPAARQASAAELLAALNGPALLGPAAIEPATAASAPAAGPAPGRQSGDSLPLPPPIRSRQSVRSAVGQPAKPTAADRELPGWHSEIRQAAEAIWGAVDPTAAAIDRPELRFRPAADLGPLTEDASRSIWRSPVLIGSVLATVAVLVLALILMLG